MTGLQKQVVPISINQGVDTKTDPKQVMAGKLLVLENGIFKTAKEIRKRYGFDLIPSDVQNAQPISTGVNIAGYNSELTLLNGQSFYSYANSTNSWFNKGSLPTTKISNTSIVRNSFQQFNADSAISGNIQVFAWSDNSNSGNIRYSVVDTETGQKIVNNQQLTTNYSPVKVLALGDYIVIIYNDSTTYASLYYKAIPVANPIALGSQVTITNTLDASGFDPIFDATVFNSRIYISYRNSSSGVSTQYIDSILSISSAFSVSSANALVLTIFGDASNRVWVSYTDNTSTVYVFVLNPGLTAVLLVKTQLATSANTVNMTGIVTGSTATIYYETGTYSPINTSLSNNKINYNTMTFAGVAGTPAVLVNGMGLSSKAFVYASVYYVLTIFPTIEQPTYFLVNQSGIAIAKYSPGLGGTLAGHILPEVNFVSSGVYQFATLAKDELVAFNTAPPSGNNPVNYYTSTGVQSSSIEFTLEARPKIVLGNNLIYGGGLPWMYDGASVVEQGFNIYPEGLTQSSSATGGAIGVGTSTATQNQVQYSAVYEWTDNQGQLHRSAPSVPLTVPLPSVTPITFTATSTVNSDTLTSVSSIGGLGVGQVITNTNFPGGTTIVRIISLTSIQLSTIATGAGSSSYSTKDTSAITITVPTLRLTAKSNVSIVIYRTQNNGTIFYRVTPPDNTPQNDKTVNTISFVDQLPDSLIAGNEQLYTTGGEVDNIAAPAISALTSYKNRAIYLSYENPNQWGYSKQVIEGSPVEFNSQLFVQTIDPKGGRLIAAAEMDDKIIFFKKSYLFYVAGTGPTPSGLNNDFQDAQVISTDTGCDDPRSIVLTPVGLMFRSPKGIYLLNRNLSMAYIGADVEAYNDIPITSARMEESLNQVRFTLSTGVCLTYDYYFNQWSVFTGINAADATSFENRYTYLSPAGVIMKENPSVYTDNLAFIKLKMKTAWFSFAGLQGFERVYKMLIAGQYKSPHYLNISVGYDFESSTTAITPIPVLSDPGVYQYRINLPRQKCESFQFTLEDSQSSPYGEGMALSNMALEVGIKQGVNKMSAAKSYG